MGGRRFSTSRSSMGGFSICWPLFDAFEHHAEPFSFRDVILAKKYAGLVAGGASWSAIARSVHQIGPVGSLTALTLHSAGAEKILARDAQSLTELDGQRLLRAAGGGG